MAEKNEGKPAHEAILAEIDRHYDIGGFNRPDINSAIINAMCNVLAVMRMTTPHIVETVQTLESIVKRRDCPGKEFILKAMEILREKISSHPQTSPLTTEN